MEDQKTEGIITLRWILRTGDERSSRYVWLLRGYSHTTARRMVPAYTKCDVQLIKLLLMMD